MSDFVDWAASAGFGDEESRPRTVLEYLEHHVRTRPESVAVEDTRDRALSYAELWERAGWLSAQLAEAGIAAGDHVAVAMRRSLDSITAMLGVIRLGAAYVPLDPQAPADRIAFVLEDAAAKLVVTGDEAEHGRWELPAGLRAMPLPESAPETAAPAPVHAGPEDTFYIGFTSGSTGRPKGVLMPHRGVLHYVTAPDYYPITAGQRVACLANPSFDLVLFEFWSTLCAGATAVVLPDAVDIPAADWRSLLSSRRVSIMVLTTALVEMVVREDPSAFAPLRALLFGGDTVDPETIRRIQAAEPPLSLLHMYGPTEATVFASVYDCTDRDLSGLERLPIGFPVQGLPLRVLGEDLEPVSEGEPGELCIGGPQVANGYLNRPELTAEKFVTLPDGLHVYRSGDLARLLPSGALEFLGRVDRQVKVRGFRVELEEIEKAAKRTGIVEDLVVEKVGRGARAHLVGFAVPAKDYAGDDATAELAVQLRAQLPEYMVPGRWRTLDTLPLSPNGKTDRRRLVAELESGTGSTAPESPEIVVGDATQQLCEQICDIVGELLGIDSVQPGDAFLELGGTSILSLQASARLRQRHGVEVNPADLLFADSIEVLSKQIQDGAAG
ncbi:MAG TPA: non-ribosomal peptide synthetase [Actinospica sp.]|jgi:amino acid adenylation domain-containing protein|nr:non-ribosomal peptide synthetase [Actinospica sp.]